MTCPRCKGKSAVRDREGDMFCPSCGTVSELLAADTVTKLRREAATRTATRRVDVSYGPPRGYPVVAPANVRGSPRWRVATSPPLRT